MLQGKEHFGVHDAKSAEKASEKVSEKASRVESFHSKSAATQDHASSKRRTTNLGSLVSVLRPFQALELVNELL